MKRRGAFITLEGGEGVGKTSSLSAAVAYLKDREIEALVTREPGGTPLGEAVRDWILHGEHGALSAEVEALLMFASRAQHLETIIRPAIGSGQWVVCDRFTDATLAYQGAGHGAERRFLDALTDGVQRGFGPDLTLLLDTPVEIGLARIADRLHDHFEREQREFFDRVRAGYLELAASEPDRIRVIDAGQDRQAVRQAIERELAAFIERFGAHERPA